MKPTWRRKVADADVHTLIGPYVLDAVTDDERVAVKRHLASCPTCRAEVTELDATATRLGEAAATPPPQDLRARVLAEAAHTRQEPPRIHPAGDRGLTRLPRWQRFTATAAAAVALVAGAVAVTHAVEQERVDSARHSAAAARADRDRVASVLAAPDTRVVPAALPGGGHARLVVSADRDEAVVALSSLPRLEPGRTYQMWLVTGSRARNAGVLDVGQLGTTRLLEGTARADAFALSTEPAGGSPQPSHVWASVPLDS